MRLPNAIIAGVQKGGTDAAVKNLNLHPNVFFVREPHFFDKSWDKGVAWYKEIITNAAKEAGKEGVKILGDKTPSYSYMLQWHETMHNVCPDAKIILFLRNPVDRAYSNYNFYRNAWKEYYGKYSFEEIIKWEKETQWGKQRDGWNIHFQAIQRGFYCEQIESLLQFFPREQLYVAIMERVWKNPEEEYGKIFDFLGVSRLSLPFDMGNINSTDYIQEMDPATRQQLEALYMPYNERLFSFLGDRVWESSL